MRYNEVEVKVKEKMPLAPIGDVHYGSKDCDTTYFTNSIGWVKSNKDIRVILMGDLINCGTKTSVGAGVFDDSYNPEAQYEGMLEMLKPIKSQILGVHSGNHEERIRELTSLDLSKMLARELGVTYLGYSALTKIRVNKFNYSVFSTHGSSSAMTTNGKLVGCKRMQDVADADIYLYGHTHGLANEVMSYRKIDFKNKVIVERKRHFVLTGNFTNWDGSYGEKKGYALLKKGCPRVDLFGNRFDTHVSL